MNGVEILASKEVIASFIFNWELFWITIGASLLTVLLLWLILGCDADIFVGCLFYIGALGLLMAAILGEAFRIPTEYKTEYKAIISDEVSMNEFLERYEIVSQEGKIYTIRERG